jgi:hypothetical protein
MATLVAQKRGTQHIVEGLLLWYYSGVVKHESLTLASEAFTITLTDGDGELNNTILGAWAPSVNSQT